MNGDRGDASGPKDNTANADLMNKNAFRDGAKADPDLKRVCFVSSAHISYNPRLVKEADALAAAGFDVRVVALNLEEEKWAWDQSIMAKRQWRLDLVAVQRNGLGHTRSLCAALRQRWCQLAAQAFASDAYRVRAFSRHAPELASLAGEEPADLFIAHNLPALPAAARAARRWGARVGYDAEDFHSGMRRLDLPPAHEDELAERIELDYLPRCDHLTAASPGVASAIADMGVRRKPTVVLNVFRLRDRPFRRPLRSEDKPLRLYWFSQVIGADRGLEDAVRALKQLPPGSVELTLRGRCDDEARRYLARLIHESGVDQRAILIKDPEPPDTLVRLAAQHDVGLALERPISQNRIICMDDLCTNKVFTYMMAGLAIAATATRDGGPVYSGAGFSYPSGDAASLAAGLRKFLEEPATLQLAKDKSWELATTRYNWEHEQKAFLSAVHLTFESSSSPA